MSLRTLEGEEVERGSLSPRDACPLPGPGSPCLFGLVLVWQSRELGHELVVVVLRKTVMKRLKLLLIIGTAIAALDKSLFLLPFEAMASDAYKC